MLQNILMNLYFDDFEMMKRARITYRKVIMVIFVQFRLLIEILSGI